MNSQNQGPFPQLSSPLRIPLLLLLADGQGNQILVLTLKDDLNAGM